MGTEEGCALRPLDPSLARALAGRLEQAPGAVRARADLREAAVALILGQDPADSTARVLLMHRSEHPEDRWSGHVSLPGGHRDPDDTSLVRTAMREAREEVGVALETVGEVLGALPGIQASGRGRLLAMRVSPVVFALRGPVRAVPGPEAQAVFTLPLGAAARGELDACYQPPERERAEGPYPGYRWAGHTVWGMTYRMVAALLERLDREPLSPPS